MDVDELVNAHWEWVGGFLTTLKINPIIIEIIKYVYKTAMIHGFKHGVEASERLEKSCFQQIPKNRLKNTTGD